MRVPIPIGIDKAKEKYPALMFNKQHNVLVQSPVIQVNKHPRADWIRVQYGPDYRPVFLTFPRHSQGSRMNKSWKDQESGDFTLLAVGEAEIEKWKKKNREHKFWSSMVQLSKFIYSGPPIEYSGPREEALLRQATIVADQVFFHISNNQFPQALSAVNNAVNDWSERHDVLLQARNNKGEGYSLSILDLPIRLENILNSVGIYDISQLCGFTQEQLEVLCPKLGQAGIITLKAYMREYGFELTNHYD